MNLATVAAAAAATRPRWPSDVRPCRRSLQLTRRRPPRRLEDGSHCSS